ncbi:MAG TPA: 2-C-methyl-D-erythritol 4-phosphate cytidylyltransferase, partial [Sphingomicrobium sp.]
MTVTALIVAAGKGERLGGGVPKQYRPIGGKPVLRWAVEALIRHPAVKAARVVIGLDQEALAAGALQGIDVGPFIQGGDQRHDSVRAGLAEIGGDAVLVHD